MNLRRIIWGIILILTGSLFLVEELTGYDFGPYFLPIILITTGLLLLLRSVLPANTTDHLNQ